MANYVYIMATGKNGTLYIGVTSDLKKRVYQHKKNFLKGFTAKYNVHSLVYYEEAPDIKQVILREKQMKKWKRYWKIKLINNFNPEWEDLYNNII